MEVFLTINRKVTQSCNWINVESFRIIFPWKWWETVAFSLCHSLLLTLSCCWSFFPVPFFCTGTGYPWATFPSGLYLLCCGAPPVALTLFSLPLCLHSRHLLLHFFLFFFFYRGTTHIADGPQRKKHLSFWTWGTSGRAHPVCFIWNQQWLSLGINSLMWNWIHQQEKKKKKKSKFIMWKITHPKVRDGKVSLCPY